MTEFLSTHSLTGLAIGLCTFLIIGMCHPLVIKGEYYLGVKCWWAFLIGGIACFIGALLVENIFWQSLLGVGAFSLFWSIKEIFEQRQRVNKGWFPRNPNRNS
ncbi:DUF4491 family protein [uncultured Muribaculum sp.]|uniref:DUF4491 family protein n=1 Tax=uncultured Muribaculum sp. TaxID=1918613 RepID=UPI0025B19133|nr:DUF4491 family protein [uncultured Muribaculum sp.]